MYSYLTGEDYCQKRKNVSTQIARHISLQLKMIEEVTEMYCNDGRMGDSICLEQSFSLGTLMQNIISQNGGIINYLVISDDYLYLYNSESYNIYQKYFNESEDEQVHTSKKWILYNDNNERALFRAPVLNSVGEICGTLLLEISLKDFYNKLFENACIYMNDSKNNMVIMESDLKTVNNVIKAKEKNRNKYTSYSCPVNDDLVINISFSLSGIYAKVIGLTVILLIEYIFFFILAGYIVNRYSKYIGESLSQLYSDMSSFMKNIEK